MEDLADVSVPLYIELLARMTMERDWRSMWSCCQDLLYYYLVELRVYCGGAIYIKVSCFMRSKLYHTFSSKEKIAFFGTQFRLRDGDWWLMRSTLDNTWYSLGDEDNSEVSISWDETIYQHANRLRGYREGLSDCTRLQWMSESICFG